MQSPILATAPGGATKDDTTLARRPLGKVPFLEVDGVPLAESQVILDYLEDAHPQPPLLSAEPLSRAKVRERVAASRPR